ncbi:hypothetical protein GJ496_006639 [Pomphorhynchus laevis]|nr:hypothetical protein GJ496_006639 [Pomphorhynchus laevis]
MPNPYDHLRQTDDDTFNPYRISNAAAALYQPNALYANNVPQFHAPFNADTIALAAQRRCVEASLFGSIEPNKDEPPPEVTICNSEMWKKFNRLGTEMIITKTGRRLFPTVKINVKGLDENSKYVFAMDIVPVDDNRYKYHDNRWIVTGKAEPHLRGSPYIHPDSPCNGSQWMRQSISFHKMKLTNNPITPQGQILMNSMHKYKPRLHIFRYSEVIGYQWHSVHSYTFPDTDFIAVTAYQNEQVTQLKIDHNPFAKGFREGNHSRRTLKRDHRGNMMNNNPQNTLTIDDDLDNLHTHPSKRSCQSTTIHHNTGPRSRTYDYDQDARQVSDDVNYGSDTISQQTAVYQPTSTLVGTDFLHKIHQPSYIQMPVSHYTSPSTVNVMANGTFIHPGHLHPFFNGFHNFQPISVNNYAFMTTENNALMLNPAAIQPVQHHMIANHNPGNPTNAQVASQHMIQQSNGTNETIGRRTSNLHNNGGDQTQNVDYFDGTHHTF